MLLDPFVTRVQDDLRSAAALGGADFAGFVDLLASTLDATLRVALIDALDAAAAELSSALAPGSIAVQVQAGAPTLVAHLDVGEAAAEPASEPASGAGASAASDSEEQARFSLRISAALKRDIETAAAREQVSANTWMSRALASALRGEAGGAATGSSRRRAGRTQGWAH